jgi:uncharacterized protein (UPF0335 family)
MSGKNNSNTLPDVLHDKVIELGSRIISLTEEKNEMMARIAAVYDEAEEADISKGALRIAVRHLMMTDEAREKEQAKQLRADAYIEALGDFATTPLGRAGHPGR